MKSVLFIGGRRLASLCEQLRVRGVELALADDAPADGSTLTRRDAVFVRATEMPSRAQLHGWLETIPVHLRRVAVVARDALPTVIDDLGSIWDDVLIESATDEEIDLCLRRGARRAGALTPEPDLVGTSSGLAEVWKVACRTASFDTPVLITGESGTGKEMFARAIHARSGYRDGAFVAVNCAAIPAGLLESELFGHRRGAFTDAHADKQGVFERAHGGTLFLDEIGDFAADLQVKLLRVLQSREIQRVGDEDTRPIDVRIISATSRDLKQSMARGSFREDLYYRLAVVPIELPPLRQRGQADVRALIEMFLRGFAVRHGVSAPHLEPAAESRLVASPWPGNVRELQNAVERLAVLAENGRITEVEVLAEVTGRGEPSARSARDSASELGGMPLKEAMHSIEGQLIAQALAAVGGSRSKCAQLLGISQRTLLYKIKEHGL